MCKIHEKDNDNYLECKCKKCGYVCDGTDCYDVCYIDQKFIDNFDDKIAFSPSLSPPKICRFCCERFGFVPNCAYTIGGTSSYRVGNEYVKCTPTCSICQQDMWFNYSHGEIQEIECNSFYWRWIFDDQSHLKNESKSIKC